MIMPGLTTEHKLTSAWKSIRNRLDFAYINVTRQYEYRQINESAVDR